MTGTRRPRYLLWFGVLAALLAIGYGTYRTWFVALLEVTSEPAGALVRVDGRRVGVTPLGGVVLNPGVHRIQLTHSHYAPFERRLQVLAGQPNALHARLEAGTGELFLYSNPRGAWVELDGSRQRGTTPLLLKLPSGEHQIAMGMAERREAEANVTVVAEERRELRLELNIAPHGSLWVTTVPEDAKVSLPGADTEYVDGVRLAVGEYHVRISRAGYVTRDVRFKVAYGDSRYQVDLDRALGRLTVLAEPEGARVRIRYAPDPGGRVVREDYRGPVRLPVGPLDVRVSAIGRRSVVREIELTAEGARVEVALPVIDVEAGERLTDDLRTGGVGPPLIVIPAGVFSMGRDNGPPSERPARRVTLSEPFAVTVHEITVAEYAQFAPDAASADAGVEPAALPVTGVTYKAAVAYADWLTAETGHRYRLPSEAEWEYLAAAGATSAFSFGDDASAICRYANIADRSLKKQYPSYAVADCDDGFAELAPVGSFTANAFGVHDVHGNVAEWVVDCGMPAYAQAPDDGTPAIESASCPTHGVRGGSWDDGADSARTAKRHVASSSSRHRGIRLVREL